MPTTSPVPSRHAASEVTTPRHGRARTPRPARLELLRRPGHIGPVNVVQLLLLELVLIAGLIVLRRHLPVLVPGLIIAVLVVVVTFGRWRGRWWTELALLWLRYRGRRRSGAVATDDRRLSALHTLAPELAVQTVVGPDEERIGVGNDGAGWFAALAIAPPDLVGRTSSPLPLDVLSRAIRDLEQPGTTVQVVSHTTPAPTTTGTAPPCEASYAELVASLGAGTPVDQVSWVAVRLDARAYAASLLGLPPGAAADRAGDVPEPLIVLARRVRKALRRAGCAAQMLDADGLLTALGRSLDLDPETAGPGVAAGERWRTWHSPGLAHACFWLRGWPDADPDTDATSTLLERLAVAPAAFTSVAAMLAPVSAAPAERKAELRCLIRVAADPDALPACTAGLIRSAAEGSARLFRLDGEQAVAAYASAPTGGGTW